MSSNKKFALSLTAMVLVAVIAVVTIVAVFAVKTQQLSTNISVRYRADQIEGSVTAKYYVGPDDKQGTDMTTGDDGGTELIFHAKDTTMEGKSLSPQENIVLEYPDDGVEDKSWVVFEYVFHNGLGNPIDTAYMATMSFDGTAENIKITTADSEEQITNYSEISNPVDNPKNFTVSASVPKKAEEDYIGTKYVYIKSEIDDPGTDSHFEGNFNWSLGYDMATYEKLEFTKLGNIMAVSAREDAVGEIIVPSKYQGKPVKIEKASCYTNLDPGPFCDYYDFSGAFTDLTNVTSITFSEGITEIPDSAFAISYYEYDYAYEQGIHERLVSNLETLILPNSVSYIGNGAFEGCDKLKYNVSEYCNYLGNPDNKYLFLMGVADTEQSTYTINSKCKFIMHGAFSNCNSLTDIEIPNNVISMSGAFVNCQNLTNVTINSGVEKIENSVFYGCSSLTNVTIPNSVTSIGARAFYGCNSLTNLEIPNSVTYIGDGAFEGCDSLAYYTSEKCNYLGNSENNYLVLMGVTDKEQETYTINPQCKFICSGFGGCGQLTNITIPNGVISIGAYAFDGCSNLRNIDIPDSIIYVGSGAFWDCTNLVYYSDGCCNYLGGSENNYVILMGVAHGDEEFAINPRCRCIYGRCGSEGGALEYLDVSKMEIPESVVYIGYSALEGGYEELIINSSKIYEELSDISFSLNEIVMTGGKIKVLDSVDTGENIYLSASFTKEEQQEDIGGKMYNVYTKN